MQFSVPFFSFHGTNDSQQLSEAVGRVINSQKYVLGEEVTGFEKEFATYCGANHCISMANGTDALELGLRALDVKKGDHVVLVANAGYYGSTAVQLIGALPTYVDIDPSTLTMSVEHLSEAIKTNPKAIIVTHLYGQLADIEAIVKAANGIPVIEDCAQAHGASINGKRAGSFGNIGCFSFYPTKNLGALGDGGAVVTSDGDIADNLKRLRQYGWGSKYHVDFRGGRNSRLDEMQAAILRVKLPHLDALNEQRRSIAKRYNEAFAGLKITCPASLGEDYVAHLYVLQTENRDRLKEYLHKFNIATDIHYPIPDHMQKAYASNATDLTETERACNQVISLPCYPGMSDEAVNAVINGVLSWFSQNELKKSC
jgi:aminotransferase EvaB